MANHRTTISNTIIAAALVSSTLALTAAPSQAAFSYGGGRTTSSFQVGITIGTPKTQEATAPLFQCNNRGCLPMINGYLGHEIRRPGYINVNGLWYPPMAF